MLKETQNATSAYTHPGGALVVQHAEHASGRDPVEKLPVHLGEVGQGHLGRESNLLQGYNVEQLRSAGSA